MSEYAERRKQLATEALEAVAYDAAVELLQEGGLPALTMERLAKKAGVSRGTLYNHFRDRDDVLVAIETRLLGAIEAELGRIGRDPGKGVFDRLEELVDSIFATLDSPSAPLLCMLFESEPEPGARRDHHIQRRTFFRQVVADLVREGQERGDVRACCSPERTAELFWGAIDGSFEAMNDKGELDRAREENVRPLIELFRRGLAAR